MTIPQSVRDALKSAAIALLKMAAEEGRQYVIHAAEARFPGAAKVVLHEGPRV